VKLMSASPGWNQRTPGTYSMTESDSNRWWNWVVRMMTGGRGPLSYGPGRPYKYSTVVVDPPVLELLPQHCLPLQVLIVSLACDSMVYKPEGVMVLSNFNQA